MVQLKVIVMGDGSGVSSDSDENSDGEWKR